MLQILILIFQFSFVQVAGQSGTVRKITLKEAVSMALLNNSDLKSGSQKKAIMADVESTYFDRVFQLCSYKILNQQALLLSDMEKVAALRNEEGNTGRPEKTMMLTRLAEIRSTLSILEDELAKSGNKLKFLLLTSDEIVPADTVLNLYALQKKDAYYTQGDSSSRVISRKKKKKLESELNKDFKKIQYFQQVALNRANIQYEKNRILYGKDEIGYAEYIQNTDEVFRIWLTYLETMNKYNHTAIRLELYAY